MAEKIDEFENAVSAFIGETKSLQQHQQELHRSKPLAGKKSSFKETAYENSERIMVTLTTEQFQKLMDQVNQRVLVRFHVVRHVLMAKEIHRKLKNSFRLYRLTSLWRTLSTKMQ